jgi:hypothetical protein
MFFSKPHRSQIGASFLDYCTFTAHLMHMKSYDRSDGETAKAYAAFTIYRNMGVSRSLDRTAVEFYPVIDSSQKRPRNIAQIQVWSRTYNWVSRCRDFDLDEEAIARERKRELDRAEHDSKLEAYRADNEEVGNELLRLSKDLLGLFRAALKPLMLEVENNHGELLDKVKLERLLTISQIAKSIGAYATQGSQLAADGLLIRQLMEKLKEGEGS